MGVAEAGPRYSRAILRPFERDRFPRQSSPIIGRLASAKKATEDAVGIIASARFAQRVFVVDPGINNDARFRTVAKEQSESTEKLRSAPMTVHRAQRIAERKLGSTRIAWDLGFDQ